MTRKTLFSSREEYTTSQAQHVPQRRPFENSGDDQHQDDGERRTGDGVLGAEYLSRLPAVRHDNLDNMTSPATESVTSPSVGHLSYSEAMSPASVYTPGAAYNTPASSYQPARKRARALSNTDSSAQFGEQGRRKNDLAGLLNPVEDDDPPTYSERLTLERPQIAMVEYEGSTASTPASQPRLNATRLFVDIQPRPPGQDVHMEDIGDLDRRMEAEDLTKRKGRKGPLESDQRRAEVLEVRELGACLRCHIMRIRCTANKDEACTNCKMTLKKARKWEIPCTREWIRHRWQCLVPDMLSQRHDPDKSIPTIPTVYLGASFKLPLTHRSGFKFEIDARTVRVSAETKAAFDNFTYDQKGDDLSAKLFLETSAGWPLVPTMRPGQQAYDHTVRMLTHHLESQKEHATTRWVAQYLPAYRGQRWAREILQLVMYFQMEVLDSSVLRKGFDLLYIRFLMNHTFYIPHDRLAEVNNELPKDDQRTWSKIQEIRQNQVEECPKYVNRWLKSAVLKIYETKLPGFFQELEGLFKLQETSTDQAKLSSLDRDEAFAALILALMLIATAQVKILQAGHAWDCELPAHVQPHLKDNAREAIVHMETKLVDHCLSLYKYRFHKQKMSDTVSPDKLEVAKKAMEFNIIEGFDKLRIPHGEQSPVPPSANQKPLYVLTIAPILLHPEDSVADVNTKLDASEENEHVFMSHNHTRLLLRLSDCVWRPKTHRR